MELLKTFSKLNLDDIIGTSFHGDTIYNSVDNLSRLFGDPFKNVDWKVQYEWDLKYKDIPFTIYDWKEYKIIKPDNYINWHIGAKNKEDSQIIFNVLNNILNDNNS